MQLYPHSPFPTALDILNNPDDVLRGAGISRPKVLYLKDLAQKILDGLPTLDQLQAMEDESIIEALTPIKGVGPWKVQMLLMLRLHQLDVLPVDDLARISHKLERRGRGAEGKETCTITLLCSPAPLHKHRL